MYINLAIRFILYDCFSILSFSANFPFESTINSDDASAHDKIRVNWDCAGNLGFGFFLLGGGGVYACRQRGEDGKESLAFEVLVE